MIHSVTYKITSSLLALLVVFSSMSFSINKHACEGEVYSSFYKNGEELCKMYASDCHDDNHESTCCASTEDNSNCCMDSYELIEGIDIEQQAKTEQSLQFFPIVFLISAYVSSVQTTLENNLPVQTLHRPPPISIDLGILFQVFRI